MASAIFRVELPERPEFTLPASRRKLLLLLLLSAALCAGGVLAIGAGEAIGWLPALFFGAGFVVFAVQLLPGATCLRVGPWGIEWRTLYRTRRLPWADIEGFGHYRQAGQEFVGINYRPGAPSLPRQAAVNVAICGFHDALPDTYGRKAPELAALLAACRGHFLKAAS